MSFRGVIQDLKRIEDLSAVKSPLMEGSTDAAASPDAFVGLDFSASVLSNTDFTEMDLSGVIFEHAVGSGCIFTGAHGDHIHMSKALLTSSIFNQAVFEDSYFFETLFGHSVFMETKFCKCKFLRTDFSCALFQPSNRATFFRSFMDDVNFSGVEGLSAEHFDGVRLNNCDFTGTGLTKRALRQRHNRVTNCRF